MKNSKPSGVLVTIAHGSESIEATTVINVLRRAEIEVMVASIEADLVVNGTRGIRMTADRYFLDVREQLFEAIVLPGGEKGAFALSRHAPLIEVLQAQNDAKRLIGAICAAPALTLAPHHLLDGRRATGYPAFGEGVPDYVDEEVVVDGHVITSQGPATSMAFGLKLVELLAGKAKRDEVAAALLY